MKTKLCITVLMFTALIFGANQYAARNELQRKKAKCPCNCKVTAGFTTLPSDKEGVSCSVVFRKPDGVLTVERLSFGQRTVLGRGKPDTTAVCSEAIIFCDTGLDAAVDCGKSILIVGENRRCLAECYKDLGVVFRNCDPWERKKAPEETPVSPPPQKPALSMFFPSESKGILPISAFLPATSSYEPADDEEVHEIITDTARWRLIDGEAGIVQGLFMAAKGAADLQSFCTGDKISVSGPGVVTLPRCDLQMSNLSGLWHGAYARRLNDRKLAAVAVSLRLRKESDSLRGELKTPDGAFNIVEASQSGSNINLQAVRTVGETQRKIVLVGRFTKGEIVFNGSEQLPGGAATSVALTGFVKRSSIADSALALAVLNQPYSFALTLFSLQEENLTLRLASPAPKQPEQITWTTEAQSLRGRNGERFTYLCPPGGTLGRLLTRDNAYSDQSSICTAAVHAQVITEQAGGVVTIEIRPGPAEVGRFVFVKGETQSGVSGRLPQGLSFDNQTGTFSGTPTELGSFEFSVVADDGTGNVFEQPLTLTVKKLAVTNGLLPDAFVGQPYAATLKVVGGQPPYRFTGEVPPGLQLDPTTGALSGRPSSRGDKSSFAVTVRDSQNNSETQNVRLRVRGTTIMNSYFLPDAEVGVPYGTLFQAVGSPTSITWEFGRGDASAIGLSLNVSTGELSGTPTKAGNLLIEVRATGQSGTSTRRFALTIKPRSGTGLRGTF